MIDLDEKDKTNLYKGDKIFFNRIKAISYYITALRLETEKLLNLNAYIPKNLKFKLSNKKEIDIISELQNLKTNLTEREEIFNSIIKLVMDKVKSLL